MIETMLAAWRLANLLVNEDGPYAILARLRHAAGIRPLPIKTGGGVSAGRVATNTWAEGLTCVWCVSVWAAAALILGEKLPGVATLRRILAVSAGAIVAHEAINRLRSEP